MSSKLFFITGLPRSRTAWFAAFMSASYGVKCAHEVMSMCQSREQFYSIMEYGLGFSSHFGNSDCGLVLTDFQKRWPQAKTLIIHRRDAQEPIEGMKRALRKLRGMHVQFENIDKEIDNIHEYLVGSLVPQINVELFSKLNIQVKKPYGSARALDVWKPFNF
jgi:hypothetical protein